LAQAFAWLENVAAHPNAPSKGLLMELHMRIIIRLVAEILCILINHMLENWPEWPPFQ